MATGTGLRDAIGEVARRASAVVRLQAELARAELAKTGQNAAAGAGTAIGAAFLAVFVFALLTALFVAALALVLPVWLSILIVMVVYIIVILVLILLARSRFRRVNGMPLAVQQAKITQEALGFAQPGNGATNDVSPGAQPPAPVVRPTTEQGRTDGTS
jgi:hypothetical protein